MTEFALSPAARRRSLLVCLAAALSIAMTLGLTWPLLSLILEAQGVDSGLIGLSSASQTIAILVIVPVTPWLMARVGTVRLMAICFAGTVATILLLPVFPNVYAWFPIRFLMGGFVEVLFIAADIWVNQIAEPKTRGRIIGLYAFVLSAGFAVGPLIIGVTGIEGWLPFVVGATMIGLGALPLLWAAGVVPPIEGRASGRLWYFLRIAPMLMFAGMMFGLIDSSFLPLLPIYALDMGLGATASVTLLTVLTIGAVIGQLPIGWAADRLDQRLMIIGCVVVIMAGCLALPLVIGDVVLLWADMLVMGAAMGGFYTIGMIMLGHRFKGADLAAANAVFVVTWGLGSVGGPTITGAAMEHWGAEAMPYVVIAFCLAYLPLAVARYLRKRWSRGGEV